MPCMKKHAEGACSRLAILWKDSTIRSDGLKASMFQKLLEQIALGLERQSIDYMVIGGQALLVYGEPRLTKDIDITLGVGVDRLKDIQRWAEGSGWKILADSLEAFVRETWVLPCLDPASGIRIDFIFSFSPYEKQAMKRVRPMPVGRAQVRFASLEDFVIHKMIAGRPRDLEDIQTVLLKNTKIETNYIRKWLGQFEQSLSQPFLRRFEEIQKTTSVD